MNKSKRKNTKKMAEREDLYRKDLRERALTNKLLQEQLIAKKLARNPNRYTGANGFTRAILQKAPKLLNNELSVTALEQMCKISPLRSVEEWQPKGKGYKTLLVSLANHLFAAYTMPAFIWSVFWDEPNPELTRLITRIAYGVSLHSLSKNNALSACLTKKQCHLLMTMPAKYSFVDAIRYVQVMTCGGNLALFNEWRQFRFVSTLQTAEMEDFWQQVLVWLCKQPDLQPKTLLPLLDFIAKQKTEKPGFSIKGRALANMLAAMSEWQQLERLRKLAMGMNLPESGLMDSSWENWSVTEILSIPRLLKEGKAMNHCVYGYKGDIRKGRCSIWSVSRDEKMKLTIEVNNHSKQIVQVRGKNNRDPEYSELQAVRKWARLNQVRCQ